MSKKWIIPMMGLVLIGLLAVVALNPLNVLAQDDGEQEFTYAGEEPAPEFPEDMEWINVPEPLTFEALKGKIVILDFWTYGCVNCMHIIPDLKRIEAEYPTQVVVIGIHSAKFENESVTANIRQIAQRYGIDHPIVNDNAMVLFSEVWGARAWPTVAIVDPLGRVVGGHSGEGVYEVLAPVLEVMVEEYGAAGLIDETPITLTPVTDELVDTPLLFPGKVLVDEQGGRLFIADSGHNRIVVASLSNYSVMEVIGSGEEALVDGDFVTAAFNSPQGITLADETLYVADTENHVIRAVDLAAGTVSTIAGTGEMSPTIPPAGEALEVSLRSPWDVLALDNTLYIAMAGTHQIWALDLETGMLEPFVGSGREDLIDAPRLEAQLAQPSGLATNGEAIYFADSEASAIRQAGLGEDGAVETLIGPVDAQARLFEFGDIDGGIDVARLQHPLGVTVGEDGLLYIADTYNNKIKIIDPEAKTSETLAGSIEGGYYDGTLGEAQFDEPGGLMYSEGKLYIADTNNHAIRVLDLETESVITIIFPNVAMLLPAEDSGSIAPPGSIFGNTGEALVLEPQIVQPGEGIILVDAVMPFGYKLNAQAPFTMVWAENEVVDVADEFQNYQVVVPDLPIELPATFTEGQTELTVDLTIYWCESINETLCFVERGTVVMPVSVQAGAPSTALQLSYTLTPPSLDDGLGN